MDTNHSPVYKEFLLGCILFVFGYVELFQLLANGGDRPGYSLEDMILGSTVQIRVYSQDCACYSLGLGTVFKVEEKHYVLTHNHWSTLFSDSIVAFYDWQNSYILEITGWEFIDLILYQDEGSIILLAPNNMVARGFTLVINQGLVKNDRLQIALLDPEEPGQIKLTEARILAYIEGEISGYGITPLSEETVVEGDSGAGIWHEDQLLGNLWSIIVRKPPVGEWENHQVSYVARFPSNFDSLVEQIQLINVVGSNER